MFQQRNDQTTIEPRLLKTRQAMKYLSVSERKLYSLRKSGAIPTVPVGKRGIRYDTWDLDAWIQKSKDSGNSSVDEMSDNK